VSARARPGRHERVGDGEHSVVWRRPGSRWCVQTFHRDCVSLTPAKVDAEYHYLLRVYARLPGLIPAQRLFTPRPDAPITEALLVKRWIEVDPDRPLGRTPAAGLPASALADLHLFVALTRDLLARAGREPTLLPDIIDTRFQNLAVDVAGRLRLLDTNRLINTNALRALPPGATLDPQTHPIHTRLLRRLMYLQVAFTATSRAGLATDPLYRRYLTPTTRAWLCEQSRADGEPI